MRTMIDLIEKKGRGERLLLRRLITEGSAQTYLIPRELLRISDLFLYLRDGDTRRHIWNYLELFFICPNFVILVFMNHAVLDNCAQDIKL